MQQIQITLPHWQRQLQFGLAFLLFAVSLVTLQPFAVPTDIVAASQVAQGDSIQQIGYGSLAALAIVSLLLFTDQRLLFSVLNPMWCITFMAVGAMVLSSENFADIWRAYVLMTFGLIAMCAIICLPTTYRDFSLLIFGIVSLIVLLNLIAGFVLPKIGIHQDSSVHVGLWRGIYGHKNTLGPMAVCVAFMAIFVARSGRQITGVILFALATFLVIKAGSKTGLGMFAITLAITLVPMVLGWRLLPMLAYLSAFAALFTLTIGSMIWPAVYEFNNQILPDPTFTSRTEIWAFSLRAITDFPLTGAGYETAWIYVFNNYEQDLLNYYDARGVPHAHNSYLNTAMSVGIPITLLMVYVVVLQPVIHYLRVPRHRPNILLSDMFMSIIIFLSLSAMFESFFLTRVAPVWLMLMFSCLALNMVSKFPLKP